MRNRIALAVGADFLRAFRGRCQSRRTFHSEDRLSPGIILGDYGVSALGISVDLAVHGVEL
ncbi:MAG: hypothetical protein RR482_10720, partial [Clostridia bacterium]